MGYTWVYVVLYLTINYEQRRLRDMLEDHVKLSKQELLVTHQRITYVYNTCMYNDTTLKKQAKKNWDALYANYNDLENENILMKSDLDELRTNHLNLQNYTKLLEQEVTNLRHLKGVTDLQTVLKVRNETNILLEELKITNISLNSVRNELEVRKQDFVSLLNTANSTKNKFEFSVRALVAKLQYQQNQTKLEMKLMQDEMQKVRTHQNQTFTYLHENLIAIERIQNLSIGKLDLEIHNMSNRAAFTVCAKDKTYGRGSKILFTRAKTRYGVSNSTLSTLANSGMFKCEKAGLYLISAYLTTDTKTYVEFQMCKNKAVLLAVLSPAITGDSFRTSTFLILQFLNIHDTIHIQTETTALSNKNERQARTKLEQHVVHLEQELLATQQGVTDIYHTSTGNNASLEQQTKNWNALFAKYNDLVNENTFMKTNFGALRTDHSNLENYTKILEQEMASLRLLKGITDLQIVLNVRNETKLLRKELKITNNSLNSVRNDAEARKKDFVALLNKAESTEHKLEFSVKALDNSINNVNQTLHSYVYQQNQMQNEIQNQNLALKQFQENLTITE
ncbi:unnamed protein product [Mytilus coruscus]|uniref:C1q domain-containing protein n=1 Tax=Mytilus coruscus TaxID=42192 RepID=A0A6J8A6U2_MYTCO|nr:unnamed protein product [Mytilus coruscus]